MRFCLLSLCGLFCVASASAQSPLVYSADSLVAPDGRVTISNPTDAAVRIDSVEVRNGADSYGQWYLRVEHEEGAANLSFLAEGEAVPVDVSVPPGGSATLWAGFAPCPACRDVGGPVDTLLVYAGGIQVPDSLLLDINGVVGTDGAPVASEVGVTVAPNPASHAAAVTVALATPERVRVAVHDVLGREVVAVHDGPAVDGGQFRVAIGGLATGTYLVRVTTASGASATTPLTVSR